MVGYIRKYDYETSRHYCEANGMVWLEEWVDGIDQEFAASDLKQGQVDDMMRAYCWRVKHLFDPKTYTFRQRLGLAAHFLFGIT